MWRDGRLIGESTRHYPYTAAHARRFAEALAVRLGLPPDLLVAGYEDAFYYLWKEGTLPLNVDPLRADLTDEAERRRLATLLDRGLGSVTGVTLPLRWRLDDPVRGGWQSARWLFRRGRMYLVPGDSPMGYRLPLDSLPWLAPDAATARTRAVGIRGLAAAGRRARAGGRVGSPSGSAAQPHEGVREQVAAPEADGVVRTALCVEPRDGQL